MGLAGISPLFIVGEDIGVMLDKSFVAIWDFWAVFKSCNAVGKVYVLMKAPLSVT